VIASNAILALLAVTELYPYGIELMLIAQIAIEALAQKLP
jgi:hypothetical protein